MTAATSVRYLGIALSGLGGVGTILALAISIRPLATVFRTDGATAGAIAILVVALYVLVGVLTIATGLGLQRFKRWAWVLGIGLSFLYLWRFPVGTAVGVYGLVVLLSSGGRRLFTRPPTEVAVAPDGA